MKVLIMPSSDNNLIDDLQLTLFMKKKTLIVEGYIRREKIAILCMAFISFPVTRPSSLHLN